MVHHDGERPQLSALGFEFHSFQFFQKCFFFSLKNIFYGFAPHFYQFSYIIGLPVPQVPGQVHLSPILLLNYCIIIIY